MASPLPSPHLRYCDETSVVEEGDLLSVRGLVVAEDREKVRSIVTPGVSRGTRIWTAARGSLQVGLAHEDGDLAADSRPGEPPRCGVLVAVPLDPGLDVRRVRNVGSNHAEDRVDLAIEEQPERFSCCSGLA